MQKNLSYKFLLLMCLLLSYQLYAHDYRNLLQNKASLENVKTSLVPNKQWIYDYVHNSAKVIQSGDEYALKVYKNNGSVAMTHFPNLSNEEIDAILNYCEE